MLESGQILAARYRLLRKLGAGMPESEILADHPHLTVEDIRAAQAFAADYIAEDEVVHG